VTKAIQSETADQMSNATSLWPGGKCVYFSAVGREFDSWPGLTKTL